MHFHFLSTAITNMEEVRTCKMGLHVIEMSVVGFVCLRARVRVHPRGDIGTLASKACSKHQAKYE
jgi:hypothetical protein